nr:methyl-accepting chemotaxis protein [Lachnospiraceae bacterium]
NLAKINSTVSENCGDVVSIIEGLSAISQENAAAAEETSASTEEVLASMSTVSDAINKVNQEAEALVENVEMFKI